MTIPKPNPYWFSFSWRLLVIRRLLLGGEGVGSSRSESSLSVSDASDVCFVLWGMRRSESESLERKCERREALRESSLKEACWEKLASLFDSLREFRDRLEGAGDGVAGWEENETCWLKEMLPDVVALVTGNAVDESVSEERSSVASGKAKLSDRSDSATRES